MSDFRVVVSALDVATSIPIIGIVAVGDSITDGSSAPIGDDMHWPDITWRALADTGHTVALANAGIGGDRLLRDARHTGTSPGIIGRFDQDVLSLSQSKIIILAAGINDISWPQAQMRGRELASAHEMPTLQDLIAGYEQVADIAHAHGRIILATTITPYRGQQEIFENFHNAEKERLRKKVNAWLRETNSFDGLIDFDQLLQDPADPDRLYAPFDSGDHIHPSKDGFLEMGTLAAKVISEILADRDIVASSITQQDGCTAPLP